MIAVRIAVIGSRSLSVDDLGLYIPAETTHIISGGARGIDTCARKYARLKGILYSEYLPDYQKFGRIAPIIRNDKIIDNSDIVIIFWDGKSRGTSYVIISCIRKKIPHRIYMPI